MAANDFQYARVPQPSDLSAKNTAGATITAGQCVTLDATDVVSGTQAEPGVQVSTTDDVYFGVALETVADGKSLRVANFGSIVQVVAGAAISAGALVMCDAAGKVKTLTAGKPQVGQALTAAGADGDKILVRLHSPAKNA
jgi:predicted RecA/RadA family phage recombinase